MKKRRKKIYKPAYAGKIFVSESMVEECGISYTLSIVEGKPYLKPICTTKEDYKFATPNLFKLIAIGINPFEEIEDKDLIDIILEVCQ